MPAAFNAAIAYINLGDGAAIVASTAQILAPPSLLQNPHVLRKWKSSSADSEYLLVDLGSLQSIDTLYLFGCSLSAIATSRVRVSSSDSSGVVGDLYDSGPVTAAVDPNYATLPTLLPAPVSGRYIRFDFSDPAASSIQVGRLFAGLRTQLQINFAYNWQVQRVDRSTQTATRGGQTQVFVDNQYRMLDVIFDFVEDSDRYGLVEAVDIANGMHTDVLFILDPSSSNPARDSIWGLVTALTPIIQPSFDVFSKEYKILREAVMAFKLPTMTRETSSTTGSGDRLLAGAVSGYVAVSAGLSDQDTTWATIKLGSAFEEGLYTYNAGANSLTPTTVYRSSNANAVVNFGAGTKDVFVALPGPSDIPASDKPYFPALMGISSNGHVNKFRNATMDVWQRGTGAIAAGATTTFVYTADGWMVAGVYSSGAGPTISRQAGRLLTEYALRILGAANVTDGQIKQRIEGVIAAGMTSQVVTVQAQIFNGTGGTITPTLTVNHPTALDNYASVAADVSAVNLQACPASQWTQVAYSFTASASAANGMEVMVDFGNNLGAGSFVQITECDIRVTPGLSTGLNSNPPMPELRPVGTELAACLRYFWEWNAANYGGGAAFCNGTFLGTTDFRGYVSFPQAMMKPPTISFVHPTDLEFANGGGTVSASAVSTANTITPYGFFVDATVSGGTLSAGAIALSAAGTFAMQASSEL